MNASIVLVVRRHSASCDEAEHVWRGVARELGVDLTVRDFDLASDDAGDASGTVAALPALLVDGRPLVVGVPEAEAAREMLARALACA